MTASKGADCGPAVGSTQRPIELEAIGDAWSYLILRESFEGCQNFEAYRERLLIARNILANRLKRLVSCGLLHRTVSPSDRRRVSYSLTDKAIALAPVFSALDNWIDCWWAYRRAVKRSLRTVALPVDVTKDRHEPMGTIGFAEISSRSAPGHLLPSSKMRRNFPRSRIRLGSSMR